MYEEKPLYLSESREIVVPSFANFCRDLRGQLIEQLSVNADRSGLVLETEDRSIELSYEPNSLNMITVNYVGLRPRYFHEPSKRETVQEYLIEHPDNYLNHRVETDQLVKIIEAAHGRRMKSAVLEPRLVAIQNYGSRVQVLPEDTPIFHPSMIPVMLEGEELVIYMEPGNFVAATCNSANGKVIYLPFEADR